MFSVWKIYYEVLLTSIRVCVTWYITCASLVCIVYHLRFSVLLNRKRLRQHARANKGKVLLKSIH